MRGTVEGWAVKHRGRIDVATVAATRRAALVNWLHLNVRPITQADDDERIEAEWKCAKLDHRGLSLVLIIIEEVATAR